MLSALILRAGLGLRGEKPHQFLGRDLERLHCMGSTSIVAMLTDPERGKVVSRPSFISETMAKLFSNGFNNAKNKGDKIVKNYQMFNLMKLSRTLGRTGVSLDLRKKIMEEMRDHKNARTGLIKIARSVRKKIAIELEKSGACGLYRSKSGKIFVVKGKHVKIAHLEQWKKKDAHEIESTQ